MALTRKESIEYARIKKIAKRTPIKITRIRGTSNVKITQRGKKPIFKQLGGNVGLSATTIVTAKKKVLQKIQKRTTTKRNPNWKLRI